MGAILIEEKYYKRRIGAYQSGQSKNLKNIIIPLPWRYCQQKGELRSFSSCHLFQNKNAEIQE